MAPSSLWRASTTAPPAYDTISHEHLPPSIARVQDYGGAVVLAEGALPHLWQEGAQGDLIESARLRQAVGVLIGA